MKSRQKKVQLSKASKLYAILGLILISITLLGSCENKSDFRPQNDPTYINQLPSQPLSEIERSSLIFMREEEKLARDVYTFLYNKWNLLIFDNIAASEQTHTDAVLTLLDKYSLTDPVQDKTFGVFANSDLQQLYNDLTTQGSASLLDALIVGATIEDLDISDLDNALIRIDNLDIKYVYENLNKGSRNHLRSFYNQIQVQNGSYTAQFITQEYFDNIVNSAMERGSY